LKRDKELSKFGYGLMLEGWMMVSKLEFEFMKFIEELNIKD